MEAMADEKHIKTIPYDDYELVVGLEVHMQLSTQSKAYSSDANLFGELPNTLVSPISLGHPGTLPMVNYHSIDCAIQLGLAMNMDIHPDIYFARKNYFYADLPKGYQITQDKTPVCTGGYLDIKDEKDEVKRILITRAHLEEDAGKSMHDQDPFDTLIDLNRAGVPLIEVVSEPDIRSSKEAYNYLTELRKLVRYLGICDGNMEEGSMRCDANISVRKKGDPNFNTRCEVKNMNSIRNVQRAIEHEMRRQIELVENGGTVVQETRNFDAATGTTQSMRSKERAHDYRYFPEPDILPLHITKEKIAAIAEKLPALPQALVIKYIQELGLSEYDALVITQEKETALWFETVVSKTKEYKMAANWLMGPIKALLNERALDIVDMTLSPDQLVGIIELISSGKVSSSTAAEKILPVLFDNPNANAMDIAQQLNLIQDADDSEIEKIAQEVLNAWPDKVAAFKAGNKGLLGLFMGELMKKSQGKANPKTASGILNKLLEK
jgi:aspartyl-tRNA(Asn)/glutamyl-tRNA(Gln) amidotransferase subunit B